MSAPDRSKAAEHKATLKVQQKLQTVLSEEEEQKLSVRGSGEEGKDSTPSPSDAPNSDSTPSPRKTAPPKPHDHAEGFGANPDTFEMDEWMNKFSDGYALEFEKQIRREKEAGYHRTTVFGFTDIAPFARNAVECLVSDSFTSCFESKRRVHWATKFYLVPLYILGVVFRYVILLPLRILTLICGFSLYLLLFLLALPFAKSTRHKLQFAAIRVLANAFLMSWCAVLTEHGHIPKREAGQIYVANHSTVFDVVLLLGSGSYSLTGQAHPGLLGFFQNQVLGCMENLWFDRLASRDRAHVAKKIKEHAADENKPPLLVFPEGTCVNNEYVVMFKRGAFELGTTIVPVAIKYNKVFVDAYWNSRTQSFAKHLFTFLTSWAVVADVYYLEPQHKREGESSAAFALRVKELIAKRAGLKSVHWDGYLKYFKPKPSMKAARQKLFAEFLLRRFGLDAASLAKKASEEAKKSLIPPKVTPNDRSPATPRRSRTRSAAS